MTVAVTLALSAATTESARLAAPSGQGQATCDGIEIDGPRTRGGCVLEMPRSRIRFTVLTVFGDEPLGSCGFDFSAHVSAQGKLVLERVAIYPMDVSRPQARTAGCGDILACRARVARAKETDPSLPWAGQIVRGSDGTLTAKLAVCLDTCLGRFEGTTRFGLEPSGKGWRLSARRARVGLSGFEMSGSWRLRQAGKRLLSGPA